MRVVFAGLKFNNPVMNAACSISKNAEDIDKLLTTDAGAVVVGSVTYVQRDGNPEPRWFPGNEQGFALNSFGMPNGGLEWFEEKLPVMVKKAHAVNKPLIVNIAGFSVQEYVDLAVMVDASGADMIEVNLGCPNTSDPSLANPIFSFNGNALKEITSELDAKLKNTPYSLKFSPFSNPAELSRTVVIVAASKAAAVVTTNTFPNGFWQDDKGETVIRANGGLAGMSGEAMLAIGLGQVRQFRQQLPDNIAVIGVGGITKPEHVKHYLKAGASAVQTATHIVRNGYAAINELVGAV